ncbi:hypothetical protein ACVWWO_005758 [Bradyrhizobium sp. F1.13.1]
MFARRYASGCESQEREGGSTKVEPFSRAPLLETTRVPQVSLNGCIPLKQGHMFSLLG